MNEEKIKEVFSDKEFVESLLKIKEPEDVQAALEEKDIDMSIAEIKKLGAMLSKKSEGELTDEELENVAGGSFTALIVTLCVAAGGCAAGAGVLSYLGGWRW